MTTSQNGTVAQLVYAQSRSLRFAQCIGEMHCILAESGSNEVAFEWAREDVAFFDLPTTRLALGWHDGSLMGGISCLTVSAGPLADAITDDDDDTHTALCSQIVERLHHSHPAAAIVWHNVKRPMTCALFDQMMQELPPMPTVCDDNQAAAESFFAPEDGDGSLIARATAQASPPSTVHPLPRRPAPAETASQQRAAKARARIKALASAPRHEAVPLTVVANDHPALPPLSEVEFARVRAALTTEESQPASARLSTPMRLSVHALNATLIFVWAPLGAVAMTYALLEGENLKMSARLTVLAGLFAASINTPFGQQMAAMAGV